MLHLLLFTTAVFAQSIDDVFSNFEGVWTRADSSRNHQVESFARIEDNVWNFNFESKDESFTVSGTAIVVIKSDGLTICRKLSKNKNKPCIDEQKNQTILPINRGTFIWIVDTGNDLRIEVTYRLISNDRMQKTISAYSSGLARQIAGTIFYDRVVSY